MCDLERFNEEILDLDLEEMLYLTLQVSKIVMVLGIFIPLITIKKKELHLLNTFYIPNTM